MDLADRPKTLIRQEKTLQYWNDYTQRMECFDRSGAGLVVTLDPGVCRSTWVAESKNLPGEVVTEVCPSGTVVIRVHDRATQDVTEMELERLRCGVAAMSGVLNVVNSLVDEEGHHRYIMPDEFVVQFFEDVTREAMEVIAAEYGCRIVRQFQTPGLVTLAVPEFGKLFDTLHGFNNLLEVVFAEPHELLSGAVSPCSETTAGIAAGCATTACEAADDAATWTVNAMEPQIVPGTDDSEASDTTLASLDPVAVLDTPGGGEAVIVTIDGSSHNSDGPVEAATHIYLADRLNQIADMSRSNLDCKAIAVCLWQVCEETAVLRYAIRRARVSGVFMMCSACQLQEGPAVTSYPGAYAEVLEVAGDTAQVLQTAAMVAMMWANDATMTPGELGLHMQQSATA